MSNQIVIPEAFHDLLIPKRYKVFYGGRGGAKSHNFARTLLIMGMESKKRIVCLREIQNSIKDSVHRLLSDIIESHDLSFFYEVQKDSIKGKNGTEFAFKGLKNNVSGLKSLEGFDIAWVEEAENVSDRSWEVLIPTIRKKGSEIWVTFNPRFPDDPTYQRMVANSNDEDFLVKKVSWEDNPFFPETLKKEKDRLKNTDFVAYKHIWEGEFDERFDGTVYARFVDNARKENRICNVPHKSGVPVITAWDLGKSDSTAIWFAQIVGFEVRIIDYYENSGHDLAHYAEYVRSKPYEYSMHFLPHDSKHDRLGSKGSIESQLNSMNLKTKSLNAIRVSSKIELARQLLHECYIDNSNCKDGLHCLMNYRYEWDDVRGRCKDTPLHDWSSDGADAFGYLAQAINEGAGKLNKRRRKVSVRPIPRGSWLAV